MTKRLRIATFVFAATMAVAGSCNAETLKKEPGPGQLPAGSVVLVDDGTCGKGKIKQVTAGSNMSGGQMIAGGSPRVRKCIPKS